MYGVNPGFEAGAGDRDVGVAGEVDGEVAAPGALAGTTRGGQGLACVGRRARERRRGGEVRAGERWGEGQGAPAEVAADIPFDRHRPLLLPRVRRVEDPRAGTVLGELQRRSAFPLDRQ